MALTNQQMLEWELGYTIMRASEADHLVIVCKSEEEQALYINMLEKRHPNLKFGDQRKPHVVVGQGGINPRWCVCSHAYECMGCMNKE